MATEIRFYRKLGVRLLIGVLCASFVVTLGATLVQLYQLYQWDLKETDRQIKILRKTILPALADSLWVANDRLLKIQLEGIASLPTVRFAKVVDRNGQVVAAAGEFSSENAADHLLPLSYRYKDQDVALGALRIGVTLTPIYQKLRGHVLVVLITQAVKTFILSLFIVFLFHYLVTRHLLTIARYLSAFSLDQPGPSLQLNKTLPGSGATDELDRIVDAINGMRRRLINSRDQRLQAAEQLAHLGHWEYTFADGQLYWSDGVYPIFGRSPEEFTPTYKRFLSCVHEEDRESVDQAWHRALSTGSGYDIDHRIVSPDGGIRFVNERCRFDTNAKGETTSAIGTVLDVTEMKQYELEMDYFSKIQSLLNRLLSISLQDLPLEELLSECCGIATSLPWLGLQPRGAIFVVDPEEQQLLLAAHRGLDPALVDSCARVPWGQCLCGRAAANGQTVFVDQLDHQHEITYAGIHPHGHYCLPFFSAGGQILGVLTFYSEPGRGRDERIISVLEAVARVLALIVERKQIDAKIVAARDEWVKTFDTIRDPIIILDDQYRIHRANQAFVTLVGMSFDEIQGRKCYELIHGTNCQIDHCPHERLLADGRACSAEIYEPRIDCHLMVNVAPFEVKNGKVIKSIHVTHDITELKKAEQELKKYAETQAVLLREVNHRVKNNLTALIGMLQMEEGRALGQGDSSGLNFIRDLSARLNGLATVHSLLSQNHWQPLSLSSLCQEIAESALAVMPAEAAVTLDVEPSPIKVSSNQAHNLALVINELVTNSVKHGIPPSGQIQIRFVFSSQGERHRIQYWDNGPGFPEPFTLGDFQLANVGLQLVVGVTTGNLAGELIFKNDHGALVEVSFPGDTFVEGPALS
ncbi:MAG: PAS domain-containing protein [Proteobacteria bacterium]|nr:PAS domain-containing protein [Pseudomonadota bacterium]MBU1687222.1 PAS domain-containing protein [Pseudomonadota bacterium]